MSIAGRLVVALGVLALIVGFCLLNVRCSGNPMVGSSAARIANEVKAGKAEMRNQEIENLARLASDFRVLAKRYKTQGENKKAQRAIGAAQELDWKIRKLQEEQNEKR